VLLFILATPLLAIIAYQSRRESYLERNPLPELVEFLQFGFLFERMPREQPDLHIGVVLPPIVGAVLLVSCLALAAYGAGGRSKTITITPSRRLAHTTTIWLVTSVGMSLLILVFALFAHQKDPTRTPLIVVASTIPFCVAAAGWVYHHTRSRIAEALRDRLWLEALVGRSSTLIVLIAFVPVAMISLLSLATPLFASRGALIYVPFLTAVVAQGIQRLRGRGAAWSLVFVVLLAVHVMSCMHFEEFRLLPVRDYRGLAGMVAAESEPEDVFLVYKHWGLTPIFYYLHEEDYEFVDRDYIDVLSDRQARRVWVFYLRDLPLSPEIERALEGYRQEQSFEVPNIWAVRYSRIGS
jgi:hypothetical protein